MDTYARFHKAIADLAADGIPFLLDTKTLTAGDAWTAAVRTHGRRVAVASECGGYWAGDRLRYHENGRDYTVRHLWISHDHTDLTVGKAVAEAFAAQCFDVDWDGTPGRSICVNLAA